MTEKQRDFINFIEDMTGIPFNKDDNISEYINNNKDKAYEKWELQCELYGYENEDAGDRD